MVYSFKHKIFLNSGHVPTWQKSSLPSIENLDSVVDSVLNLSICVLFYSVYIYVIFLVYALFRFWHNVMYSNVELSFICRSHGFHDIIGYYVMEGAATWHMQNSSHVVRKRMNHIIRRSIINPDTSRMMKGTLTWCYLTVCI